jgi:NADH-quinone oxidoreductase E subunit
MTAQPSFSPEDAQRVAAVLSRYPDRRAALIPTLYIAQHAFGHLSDPVLGLVSRTLGMPPSAVLSVATFYTMLRRHPVGRYHVQVCTNVSCHLRGADDVMAELSRILGISPGQTTADGLFTLEAVECLAACGQAPALQINLRDHFEMSPEKARALVAELRAAGGRDA